MGMGSNINCMSRVKTSQITYWVIAHDFSTSWSLALKPGKSRLYNILKMVSREKYILTFHLTGHTESTDEHVEDLDDDGDEVSQSCS